MNLLTPAEEEAALLPPLFQSRTVSGVGQRLALGGPPAPRRRRIAVSDYRVFTTVVLGCIISLDVWSDLKWSSRVSTYVVGPSSVLAWALTLVGSFGIGPVYRAWNAFYVRPRSRRLGTEAFGKDLS